MRHDLRAPCKNCPFRSDDTRIRFASRERAEEIEESAYRNGFPCHKSAVLVEDEDGDGLIEEGYHAGEGTQHCVGYVVMMLNQGDTEWPGVDNDDEIVAKYDARISNKTRQLCFQSVGDFLDANNKPQQRQLKRKRITR